VLRLTPLLAREGFLGFQQEEEEEDWVNSAIMGLRPGSDFARRCLERNDELFARTGRFWRGPTVTTMVLKELGLRRYGLQAVGGVTLYPIEAFSPFPWFGSYSHDCIRPETYCVHHWEASWQKSPLFSLRRRFRMAKRRVVGWLGAGDDDDGGDAVRAPPFAQSPTTHPEDIARRVRSHRCRRDDVGRPSSAIAIPDRLD
jgi:hypothetical protein